MVENNSEVLSGMVVKRIRDGRCRYDPQVKQELVKRALQPGVSVRSPENEGKIRCKGYRKPRLLTMGDCY